MVNQVEKTISADELVYDFPERTVRVRQNGFLAVSFESWGIGEFDFDGGVDIGEKRITLKGDMNVTISYREAQLANGDVIKENIVLEGIE